MCERVRGVLPAEGVIMSTLANKSPIVPKRKTLTRAKNILHSRNSDFSAPHVWATKQVERHLKDMLLACISRNRAYLTQTQFSFVSMDSRHAVSVEKRTFIRHKYLHSWLLYGR